MLFTGLAGLGLAAHAQGNLWVTGSAAQANANANNTNVTQADTSVLQEMERAYARHQSTRLTQLLPSVAGNPLEVYGAYWELKSRLESASTEEIRAFLQRWQGTYFEDRLRNDWLLLLGQTGDSVNFAREWPLYRMRDDADVRCWATSFGLQSDAAGFLQDWQTARGSSSACEAAAQRLLSNGKISPADVWRKADELALGSNWSAAPRVVALVDTEAAERLKSALSNPRKSIEHMSLSAEVARAVFARYAAQDADGAADALRRYAQARAGMSNAQRDWIWGAIGQQAAMSLSGNAGFDFAQAKAMQGWSDEMLAWRVRAALRAGLAQHADEIVQSIAAMSDKAQRDPTWVYWQARALASTGSKDNVAQAQKLYRSIASMQGFYEMLATEELGGTIAPPVEAAHPSAADIDKARSTPGFARAMLAIQAGLRTFGVREWSYTAHLQTPGGLPARELLAAAEWACQMEVWDRCINTAERTPGIFAVWQRYPMPHQQAVLGNSASVGMDAAYVYGLIRQESRFVTSSRSGVGASGLMQLMPATARWTARKIGLAGFSPDQVYDSQTNVLLGVNYLRLALESFQGSRPLAAAAYNAGPGRARRWREGAGSQEGAIWVENIPYAETRDYVKKVLANTTMYAAIISGKPQSLRVELGQVDPAGSATAVVSDLP